VVTKVPAAVPIPFAPPSRPIQTVNRHPLALSHYAPIPQTTTVKRNPIAPPPIVELAHKTQTFLIVVSFFGWFIGKTPAYAGYSVPIDCDG
jgi:hypothetical protein